MKVGMMPARRYSRLTRFGSMKIPVDGARPGENVMKVPEQLEDIEKEFCHVQ
jgi:hypothetical protein